MSETALPTLIVAITARALFDLEHSHGLFEREGVAAYAKFQRHRENETCVFRRGRPCDGRSGVWLSRSMVIARAPR